MPIQTVLQLRPANHLRTNIAGAPMIVSDPNQVANVTDAARNSGNRRPASTKSCDVVTRRAAHAPTAILESRYREIKKREHRKEKGLNTETRSAQRFKKLCVLRVSVFNAITTALSRVSISQLSLRNRASTRSQRVA